MKTTDKKHTSNEVKQHPDKKQSSGDKQFDLAVDLLLKPLPKSATVK